MIRPYQSLSKGVARHEGCDPNPTWSRTSVGCWQGRSRLFLLLALGILLCGCNQDDDRQRTIAADRAAELSRITDPVHGADQIRRRIVQNLKVDGPYIAIRINDGDVQVISAATPWTVRCDYIAGISIAFTSNITDQSGGLVMQISEVRPDSQQCLEIALPIAKVLDAVLAGH